MDHRRMAERYLQQGCCCGEAIIRAALELSGEENESLARAAAGLCSGLWSGHVCGALTGGAMMLSLFEKSQAAGIMIPELTEWFDKSYGMEYGSMDCGDIAGPGMRFKAERCRNLTIEVYEKCVELLEENGLLEEKGLLKGRE